MQDFIWLVKPIFFFWGFYYLWNLQSWLSLKKFERNISILFLICLLYGAAQSIGWFLYRIELPMLSMKTIMGAEEFFGRGFSFRRVASIFGHPLWFGYLCSLWTVFHLWQKKYLFSIIAASGIFLCFSRWALVLTYLSIFWIQFEQKDKISRAVFILCNLTCIVLIMLNWSEINHIYDVFWHGYSSNSIKMIGIQDSIHLFTQNPLGYGFGSFGTINSIGSLIYRDTTILSFMMVGKRSGIEAVYFILLVQVGFIGIAVFVAPFLNFFLEKSKSRFLLAHLLCLPIVGVLYIPLYLATLAMMVTIVERAPATMQDGLLP